MKYLNLFAATAGSILAMIGGASAYAQTMPVIAYNAAITNDYLFRGLSQTSGKAAAQGGADLTSSILYAGVWLSNVDFGPTAGDPGDKTSLEYDLYGGVRPVVSGVNFDFGVIRYGYTRAPSSAHYPYWEAKASVNKAFGAFTPGAAFAYSPEFFGKVGSAEYYEVNGVYAFPNKASLSGAVGYQAYDDKKKAGINGYTTWNVGVGYPITDKVGLDFRYWGTENKATTFYTKTFAGDRLVATVKATF